MKKILTPMFLAAMVAASGPALAWSSVSGSVTSVDPNAHQFGLDNGKTYTTQSGVNLTNLSVGDKVTVSAETKSGQNLVNKIHKKS